MKSALRLWSYAVPHRRILLAACGTMVVYGAASAGLVSQIEPIVDNVLLVQTGLAAVVAAILGFSVLKGLGAYGSVYLMTAVGERLVRDLRSQLFGHILGQSAAFFARHTTGSLMSRTTNDINRIQYVVSQTLGDLTRESITLVFLTGLLVWHDARLALVCLTGAPLVVYPLVRLGQRVRRTTRRSQDEQAHLSHLTAEAFGGHRIVKTFGGERYERQRFDRAAQVLYRINLKITSTLAILPPLMEWLGALGVVAVLYYGMQEIAAGDLTPGAFTQFIAVLLLMYGPIKKLSRVNASIQQAIAAADRIFEILDTHSEVHDRPGAIDLPPRWTAIRFNNVSFVYPDSESTDVLRGVSFTVPVGQVVAIVGPSGAGKTTLVNLLPRLFDPTGGSISIDGVELRDVALRSLRRQIGMVTQDIVLFDDTVTRNIGYAAPDASRTQVEAAARAAHAHQFIVELPDGYDTLIGDRGQRLSGGQRQRLAIARALLRNAPILILDEATSSLDAESEVLVQAALAELMHDRTVFVIAHRLSTVRRADAIIVLDRGQVVDYGRHDDLVANRDSLYARLCARQFDD